ncbi:MAG: VCBS repeat-containing protein [Paenibacillaceae bacterium]|nr:VCBS repeat-containing protein [Paenibacillaceae bacterium]
MEQLSAHTANVLTIADFNRNGILDIFVTSYNAENRLPIQAHSSCGAMAIDFNEDGRVDLAIANHKTYGDHVGYSYTMWNGPEGFAPNRMTKLPTMGLHGMMSVDPGNIADRGTEEFYISSAYELPAGEQIDSIGWDAELQPKTRVRAQLHFADSGEALEQSRGKDRMEPRNRGSRTVSLQTLFGNPAAGCNIVSHLAPLMRQ